MGIGTSTYYGLTKVRDQSPSAKDWATTDFNFELLSRLLKSFEQHHHSGGTAIDYPGFQIGDPTNPIPPTITEFSTGGILTPGTAVGVRLGFQNALGLETQGSPEVTYTTLGATAPPLTPVFVSSVGAVSGGLPGGNYIYAMTKKKGSGETTISNVLPVTVAYDQNYNVTISFAAINTYTDGTDAYNIYRSAGLDAAFQLITTITNTATTSFADTNTIAPGNQNVQPPVSNTFDASKKVRIDWSAITLPPEATRLRVYITQQSGIWSTNHLLQDFDLTVGPPNFIDYLGSESLQTGWPAESSEIPNFPPKLNLGTEATGAPTLTADMDFAGFKAKNMSINFVPSTTLADGLIWYDSSTSKFKGRANSTTIDITAPPAAATNYVGNPNIETDATNWAYHPGSGFSASSMARTTTNPYTGNASLEFNATRGSGGSTLLQINYVDTVAGGAGAITSLGTPTFPGQIVYVQAKVKLTTAASINASTVISLAGTVYNSAGGSGTSVTFSGANSSITNPTLNTWYNLEGWFTTPAAGAYYIFEVRIGLPGATLGSVHTAYVDNAMAVPGVQSTSTTVPYFDGDSPNAVWKSTPRLSPSQTGGYSHSTEEAGGHLAVNIRHHSGDAFITVKSILNRFVNSTTGLTKNVLVPTRWSAPATTRTTSSTSPTGLGLTANPLDLMTVTTEYTGQWYEVTFDGHFTVDTVGATLSVGIEHNSSLDDTTIRSFTAPAAGASISFSLGVIDNSAFDTESFRILWWVSAGTATAVSGRQRLVHRMLI